MPTAWPTLSTGAQREDYNQTPLQDPTVRKVSADGRVASRRGCIPILYSFSFSLRHLSALDKETLESFQEGLRIGGDTITWTDERPTSGDSGVTTIFTTRLAAPMEFDLDDDGTAYRTDVVLLQEPS